MTKNERLQDAWRAYEAAHDRLPTSARQAAPLVIWKHDSGAPG